MMDELLEQFLIEGRDLIAQAHADLLALERDPGDRGAIESLFRATHTLKGSVALFDMAPAEALLHAAESLLDRTRRAGCPLPPTDAQALLSVIDQTDRWIDALTHHGGLPPDAASNARDLIAALSPNDANPAPAQDRAAGPDWLEAALSRPDFAAQAAGARTAFRYMPDPDCFFRGEDPLAIVAAIPELLALALSPAGQWPSLDAIEPFQCITIIEGLSGAGEEAVRTAFRLMPDQVSLASLTRHIGTEAPALATEAGAQTLRVEAEKLDLLAARTGELAVALHGLSDLAERAMHYDRTLAADLRRAQAGISRAASAVQSSVATVRLVSLQPVLRRLPRLARELAASLGKQVRFRLEGDATQVDKQIADALFEPLLHLVRNAIDHGIEESVARAASGKAQEGEVALAIASSGDQLFVTLTDDGRGIDPARMRSVAVEKGLLSREAADALDDAQALKLIFRAGFSTASSLSAVSGRGVGMDAVDSVIGRLQGSIDIDSTVGAGTRFTLRLPLNAITTRLLTVSAGGAHYGLRLDQVIETVRIDQQDIQPVGQGHACVIRDRTVPVLDLDRLLGGVGATSDTARLVVSDASGERVALRVDALGDRIDAMVRQKSGLLASIPSIAGTTVLGDGSVLLVLDLPELVG